ncbi:alpha-1,6-glucosidase domain-containing protein [Bdellovibrio reynosensis]|uniref:DUF3372 domain-containing protein n=1 Tax=Bdellovibrio reynosensis TaxID=2835041 RepID=A0ABY4C6R9_9BACT|nr:alpha-1,6-glucosidase domain-containing protein [Bdellovibrio reynosensis]UOF00667.1 DUF3372 domain-containing protein [Bdellovibrio reynosensis]
MAADARANWINSTQLKLKLPPGFYVSANTQFFFMETATPLNSATSVSLPLLAVENSHAVLSTGHLSKNEIDELIRRPLKVVISNNNRTILDTTSVQYSGLLDDLYFYNAGDLGGQCGLKQCSIKLWAPTAQSVKIHLFKNRTTNAAEAEVLASSRNELGVWELNLPASYENYFYLFEVTVFQPLLDRFETTLVTDPYSLSLALDGEKSQLVNLNSAKTTPPSWSSLQKPRLNSLNDSVIYEMHIRDFSAIEENIPETYRGTYLAFTQHNSSGVKHLKELANAGLTHLHLLPFNDFGSVKEKKSEWENYDGPSSNLQEPQSVIGGMRKTDPFNWGYDPVHFLTPEGSYAVDGDGANRIREVRQMVQAINGLGLRVVQDVVFNHTYEQQLEPYSVFDKIVPLYYYRLDDEGKVHKSSCCNDTASENRMMEKLMIDAVLYWARTYKIDGFRFDLMSFHSKATMERIRQAVRSLTIAQDGVDGSKILLYGEGWTFGSFNEKYPRDSMTLENSYGTDYGFFNDRLRDAVRGGTTNSHEKSDQGFATGLFFDFNFDPANRNSPVEPDHQRGKLLHYGDVIKVGLAGNLRDYRFREHLGTVIRAGDLRFRNSPVAFAKNTVETINYVSAHDGYGLWDAVQAKAPHGTRYRTPNTANSEERRRIHQLALSFPLLGQGIPFVESGTELLRSKNGDQDSYDSGDFFNRIDWTGTTNFWGEGLPPAWKNLNDWGFWQPRLQNPEMKVTSEQIAKTNAYFKALLRLRCSSDLFKLNSTADVTRTLQFIDNDHQAEPGLIAMLLQNNSETLLVFFNASREARNFTHPVLENTWKLHPLFDEKIDSVLSQVVLKPEMKSVQIPGRTTLVLQLQAHIRNR